MQLYLPLLAVLLIAGVSLPVLGQSSVKTEWNIDFSGVVQQVSFKVEDNNSSLPAPAVFKLGALYDARGAVLGADPHGLLAIRAAVDHWNSEAQRTNNGVSYKLYVEDSGGEPEKTLAAAKRLYEKGVRVFLGPSDSASLEAVKRFSEEKGALFISSGSTNPSLQTSDNLYRNIIRDSLLGAVAISHASESKFIAVRTADWFGDSLHDVFSRFGGDRYVDAGSYEWETPAAAVLEKLDSALKRFPKAAVAFASYDEAEDFALLASRNPSLWANRTVYIFGQNFGSLPKIGYARLAGVARLVNLGYNAPDSSFKRSALDLLKRKGLLTPDDYSLLSFDSAWLALSTFDYVRSNDFKKYKTAFEFIANTGFLTTGAQSFDEAGDRDNLGIKFEGLEAGPTPAWKTFLSVDVDDIWRVFKKK